MYPWGGATAADDYSIANVGQLKAAFAFNIPIFQVGGPPADPNGNGSIPALVFNTARLRWEGLAVKPQGSSGDDFDGDGINNAQEYRMSVASPGLFPTDKALIDPNDVDGDGLLDSFEDGTGGKLSSRSFADAVADYDGDGLTNYEEVMDLAASQATAFDNAHSIRDNFMIPYSGGQQMSPECELTDGQIMRWRRDIARWNFNPGLMGSADETSPRPNVLPTQAPPEMWDWMDADADTIPDGYALWLAEISLNGGSNPAEAASSDVDEDGLPNLWEHRYRLGVRTPSNCGAERSPLHSDNAGDLLPLAGEWFPGNDTRSRIFHQAGTVTGSGVYYEWYRWHSDHVWTALPNLQDPDGPLPVVGDTLPNFIEHAAGGNPRLKDTDGDGFDDWEESQHGSGPNDSGSTPPVTMNFAELSEELMAGSVGSIALRVQQAGRRIRDKSVKFELVTPGTGAFDQGSSFPPTVQPVSRLTDTNGDTGVSVRVGNAPGQVLTVRVSCDNAAPVLVSFTIVPPPEPPLYLSVSSTASSPLAEGTTVGLTLRFMKSGAPHVIAGAVIQLTANLGSFLPNPGGAPLQSTTVTTDANGEASISWKAPVFGMGTANATIGATAAEGQEGGVGFQVIGARPPVPPGPGGGGPGGGGPAPVIPPTAPPMLFTSVRVRSGYFNGSSEPTLEIKDGVTGSRKEAVWVVDEDPPEEPTVKPLGADDGFDGDLDYNTNDPGDPRDENARTLPYQDPAKKPKKTMRPATDEEIEDGDAREEFIYVGGDVDEEVKGTSDGPRQNPKGNFVARGAYISKKPKERETESETFDAGQLDSLIEEVPFGDSNEKGWMGDGAYGLRPVSANARYSSEKFKVTYKWIDSEHEAQDEKIDWKKETASKIVRQVRLQSHKPVETEGGASATFLLIKNVFAIPEPGEEPGAPQITSLGTVTLKIPQGGTLSQESKATGQAAQYVKQAGSAKVIELKVDQLEKGKEIVLDLLPINLVQITNGSSQVVNNLTVAMMEDSLNENDVLDIDVDPSRFYVSILGLTTADNVSIKLATVENPDSSYNDNETELKLEKIEDGWRTKSLLLVSDDVDDLFGDNEDQPNYGADDQIDDRTHKIQLGGKVKVAAVKINSNWNQTDITVTVPVQKTLSAAVHIASDTGIANILEDIKVTNERLAQVGIRIDVTFTDILSMPQTNGLDTTGSSSIVYRQAYQSFLRACRATTHTIDDFEIFVVTHLRDEEGDLRGMAVHEDPFSRRDDIQYPAQRYENTIVIAQDRGIFTLAHEILHLLTRGGHYGGLDVNEGDYGGLAPIHKISHCLIRTISSQNVRGGSKRIYLEQVEYIRVSRLLRNP